MRAELSSIAVAVLFSGTALADDLSRVPSQYAPYVEMDFAGHYRADPKTSFAKDG
jgi:hypothetical protein